MSSAAVAARGEKVLAAWETDYQICWAEIGNKRVDLQTLPGPRSMAPHRQHAALAIAPDGSSLLAWAEGTGWNKGGSLAWQGYDVAGKSNRVSGRINGGIPVWGLPAVVADRNSRFIIIY